MPRDPNGVMTLPASTWVQTGDTVLPVQHNSPFLDIENALTNSIDRDGRTVMTGPLQMGGNRITNVAPGTNGGDALNVLQLRDRVDVAADFATVSDLLADNNQRIGYAGSGARVIVTEGQIITAQGFRLEVIASGAVEFDVVTEGGVKLNYAVLGDDDLSLRSKFSEVNGTISTAPLNLSESEKTQARLNIGLDDIAPQGHIFGLALSRAVGTDLVLIRPGEAAASGGNPRLIRIGGEWTKNLASAWSEGNGGGLLDAGAISNGTYHIFIIRKPESNEGDILASQSATSPIMPEGYTFKRRIGSIIRVGSAIRPFFQDGDRFTLITPQEEINVTNTVAKTYQTLAAVPSGIRVKALFNIVTSSAPTSGNGIQRIYLYDGQYPGTAKEFYARASTGSTVAVKQLGEQYTDASGGIEYETAFSGGGLACTVQTLGWEDTRGRLDDPVEEVFAATFGFATDIHNGDKSAYSDRYPRDGVKKLNDAVSLWNSRQVDFGIIIGDLIDTNAGAGAPQGLADLAAIETAYSNLTAPRHYAFGNHDFDVLSKAQFISNTDMPSAYYSFDQGGIHFVVLDACNRSDSDSDPFNAGNYVWNQAYVNPAQRSWLTSDLASTSLPTVVFSHYGLHGGGYSANNHAAVRAILEASGKVKSVITGHQHVNARTAINGINYYVMMAMTQFPHPQNSYSVIGVRPDGTCRVLGFGNQSSYG